MATPRWWQGGGMLAVCLLLHAIGPLAAQTAEDGSANSTSMAEAEAESDRASLTRVLIDATALLGFVLTLFFTQAATARSMACLQVAVNATLGLHLALLGAWPGVGTQVIGCVNGAMRLGVESGISKCKKVLEFAPLAVLPLAAYTYREPRDLLPSMGVLGRMVSLQLSNLLAMRLLQLFAMLPWTAYFYCLGAWWALLGNIVTLFLQLGSVLQHHVLGQASKAEKKAEEASASKAEKRSGDESKSKPEKTTVDAPESTAEKRNGNVLTSKAEKRKLEVQASQAEKRKVGAPANKAETTKADEPLSKAQKID